MVGGGGLVCGDKGAKGIPRMGRAMLEVTDSSSSLLQSSKEVVSRFD